MWTTQGERSVWGQVPDEGDPREGPTAGHLSTDTCPIGPGDTAVGLPLTRMVTARAGGNPTACLVATGAGAGGPGRAV